MALLTVLFGVAILSATAPQAFAKQLAMRGYTTTDGLPSNFVTCAYRDSRGFLWVCTRAGLARFDGQVFTPYSDVPGLPDGTVRNLIETRGGTIWIATTNGIAHFDPRSGRHSGSGSVETGRQPFRTYGPANADSPDAWDVWTFVEAADGTLWAGAADGLYRRRQTDHDWWFERVVPDVAVLSLVEDKGGSLWAGTATGSLLRRNRSGRIQQFDSNTYLGLSEPEPPGEALRVVFLDVEGRLWISLMRYGVCRLHASTEVPRVEFCYRRTSGLLDDINRALTQSVDGSIWMSSNRGPMQIEPPFDGSPARLRTYADAGLDIRVSDVTADRDGNIWLSTGTHGLLRVVGGLTRYGTEDGLTQDGAPTLFLDRTGALCHVFAERFSRFDGERFTGQRLSIPRDSRQFYFDWGWTQAATQDRQGRWWVATDLGAYRFPAVSLTRLATTRPDRVLTRDDGLPANHIATLFVDRTDSVWICTVGLLDGQNGCARWRPSGRALERIDWSATGAPNEIVTAIAEDHYGQVWLGLSRGGLVRYATGRLTAFGAAERAPGRDIHALHVDRRGRLWVGSSRDGLARLDDTRAARPRFVRYTRREGFSSNAVHAIAEDRFGRIYVGTNTGLDQLDPDTATIRHFTARDGVGAGGVHAVVADAQGAIWFATGHELTRFVPRTDRRASASPVRVMRVRVNGQSLPLSQLGERWLGELKLGPRENSVQLDFGSVSLAAGELLRYEHRLLGADTRWSAPTWERSITYAELRPGHYRFEVRTSPIGRASSSTPAVVAFVILPPIWQRWWFLLLAGATVALAIYAVHRLKLERAVALERMRMRIATDLHDDVGGTLSRMAIISEVAKRHAVLPPDVERRLDDLGETARGLVDAMSDVIWSIDPRRDHLASLLLRVREHATDVLDGTAVQVESPVGAEVVGLSPDQRRQLYLILKEALTNVAKHACAQHVVVAVTTNGHVLDVDVRDDGRGFDSHARMPAGASEHHADDGGRARRTAIHQGNGLTNMRTRAATLGGSLKIRSGPSGTTLQVQVPLASSTRSGRLQNMLTWLRRREVTESSRDHAA